MKTSQLPSVITAFTLALLFTASPVAAQHHHENPPGATTASATRNAPPDGLPTAEFRNTHKTELEHLNHVEQWSGALAGQSADEQKKTAANIVDYFRNGLVKHAEWEEAHLYPLIDKLTRSEKDPFTSTMRHEHKIIVRGIEWLEEEAAKTTPDYKAFARKTDMLLGLVRAHFELEDEVLLPYVDKNLTRAEFEKAIGEHH